MADSIKYQAILFDLDGTLLDSLEDLADSMNQVLFRQNFPVHPIEQYKYFVGDGVRELTRRVLPEDQRDDVTVAANVGRMEEEYSKRWNCKTRPYPGMEEALDGLTAAGTRLAVLSNKPDSFTKMMVPALLPRWNFHPVVGARQGVPVKPHPQAALEIAALMGIVPACFLYVGDTATDMRTANAAGMHAVGVTWGFRELDELLQNGARSIVNHPGDLLKLLY